jgi:hypothetical protein
MLKKFIFSLTAIMALSLVIMAQDKAAKEVTLTGAIADKHCAGADMATHGKGCVLADKCKNSGLGVVVDGKFTAFDKAGSAKAQAALEKSKKEKGATFKVTGTVAGDTMTVKSIEEAP